MSRFAKMDDFYARPRVASNVGYWRDAAIGLHKQMTAFNEQFGCQTLP